MLRSIFLLIFISLSLGYSDEKPEALYVFIGQKISLKQFDPDSGKETMSMDEAFRAKYRVLENVYGGYKGDTIEFEVYDHYGIPKFSEHKTVLLYVSKYDGKLYHEKYQYSALYKTTDGRWAGTYSTDYDHPNLVGTKIKPVKIDFAEEVSIPILRNTPEVLSKYYPKPYFEIAGNKAIAKYGNYVPELFELKKQGVLKARGLF